jgi:hypothetical protein
MKKLEKKLPEMKKENIRSRLSQIRADRNVTLNAAAQIFARSKGFSVMGYLNNKEDLDSLKTVEIKKFVAPSRPRKGEKILEMVKFQTDNNLLNAHIGEINRAYTHRCYTSTFVLCRKVLENLITGILRKKYPDDKREHREKYFDFNRGRFHDFGVLLKNLGDSKNDFGPEKQLVKRICELASKFKETADEMTHSLYHIASKKEIDEKNFQQILDLVQELEKKI